MLGVLLLLPYLVKAQERKDLSLSFNLSDFIFNYDSNGYLNISSSKYDCVLNEDSTKFSLPYVGVNVLIGKYEYLHSYEDSTEYQLIYSNINISRNSSVDTISINKNRDISKINYRLALDNDSSLEKSLFYCGEQVMDGYHLLSFIVSPFKYDTISKKLYIAQNIHLTYYVDETMYSPSPSSHIRTGNNMRDNITNMVINPSQIDSLYISTPSQNLPSLYSEIPYEYIIITNDSLKNTYQQLAYWKTIKGVKTKVLSVEYIDSMFTAPSRALRIKQAIKSYYDGTIQTGLRYVLLGGGDMTIPIITSRIEIEEKNKSSDAATDLFYSCFDTMDWDNNGNGIIGEFEDEIDLLPEIFIGRIPTDDYWGTRAYVKRVIDYEKGNITYKNKILMAGMHMYRRTVDYHEDGTPISDAEFYGDKFYNEYIYPFTNIDNYKLYDTFSSHEDYSGKIFISDNLQTELSKGYPLAFIQSHGSYSGWSTQLNGSNNIYNRPFSSSLQNSEITFILSPACHTNDILNYCLSTSFFENSNSGILGYYGNTKEGWINKSGTSFSDVYNFLGKFIEEVFKEPQMSIGKAVVFSRRNYTTYVKNYFRSKNNYKRWTYIALNLMADPELTLYKNSPYSFDNVNIIKEVGTLSISTGLQDCKICVSSSNNDSINFYYIKDETDGIVLPVSNPNLTICITKNGYKPYICRIYDNKCIQNEYYDYDNEIQANKIEIGHNITTEKPEGAIYINKGKMKIKGHEGVYIKNSLYIKKGAEFIIK